MNPIEKYHGQYALHVGGLHPRVTEAMLFKKFSTVGPLLSIHVCRDLKNCRPLGYAYVNFKHKDDAERALATMNSDMLEGRPINISWSQRDPSLRKSPTGNVFIKNLNKDVDSKTMYDTFSAFGNILSCKIAQELTGDSKGYGFVQFETEEAASMCIDKCNGMLMNGKKIYVGKFIPRQEREKELEEKANSFTNVYVQNFGEDFDDVMLLDMFSKYGDITSYKLVKDEDGKLKGYGFVVFEDPEAAQQAVDDLNGKELNFGKPLKVERAKLQADRQQEIGSRNLEQMKRDQLGHYQRVKLLVQNLGDTIDDKRLRKEFAKFGMIRSAEVILEDGRSKGYGFVCFTSPEEAAKAVAEMNGRKLGASRLHVTFAHEHKKPPVASQPCVARIGQRLTFKPNPIPRTVRGAQYLGFPLRRTPANSFCKPNPFGNFFRTQPRPVLSNIMESPSWNHRPLGHPDHISPDRSAIRNHRTGSNAMRGARRMPVTTYKYTPNMRNPPRQLKAGLIQDQKTLTSSNQEPRTSSTVSNARSSEPKEKLDGSDESVQAKLALLQTQY